jgi:hypothetical protein
MPAAYLFLFAAAMLVRRLAARLFLRAAADGTPETAVHLFRVAMPRTTERRIRSSSSSPGVTQVPKGFRPAAAGIGQGRA